MQINLVLLSTRGKANFSWYKVSESFTAFKLHLTINVFEVTVKETDFLIFKYDSFSTHPLLAKMIQGVLSA